MSEEPIKQEEQIGQWLKKLEQESWQLELLVSAFTIFLLIMAIGAYDIFLEEVSYKYNLDSGLLTFVYVFMLLLGLSINALVVFMILHLMLRGFWIGAIGLRSVQSNIDFKSLNYSDYFTDKLKKKVISLDDLVIMLDEICSLIFSFAFLIMSTILAFGLYFLVLGVLAFSFGSLATVVSGVISTIFGVILLIILIVFIISGLIYFIDYFTLGFFKKFKWFSKLYYPFYRFYGTITLAVISRSIYYYLISRFSKKRIRIVYAIAGIVILLTSLVEYDQYQFYPDQKNELTLLSNQYDNLRSEKSYIEKISIQSNVTSDKFIQLFIRYNPEDNELIQGNCPDFIPAKQDGFNWSMTMNTSDGNLRLTTQEYNEEDKAKLMECLSMLYQVSINDSIYSELKYYYYTHPHKGQKGLLTMISSSEFIKGENILMIKKSSINDEGEELIEDFAHVPFWFQ